MLKLHACEGLNRTVKSDAGERWVVGGKAFSFLLESAVPAGTVRTAQNNLCGGPEQGINIRPMNLAGVASAQTISIVSPVTDEELDLADWTVDPTRQGVPGSLWGAPLSEGGHFVQSSGQPTAETVDAALTGVRLAAPEPRAGDGFAVSDYCRKMRHDTTGAGPLSPDAAAESKYAGGACATVMEDLKGLAGEPMYTARKTLCAALKENFAVLPGEFTRMAARSAGLFYDAPMATLTAQKKEG